MLLLVSLRSSKVAPRRPEGPTGEPKRRPGRATAHAMACTEVPALPKQELPRFRRRVYPSPCPRVFRVAGLLLARGAAKREGDGQERGGRRRTTKWAEYDETAPTKKKKGG